MIFKGCIFMGSRIESVFTSWPRTQDASFLTKGKHIVQKQVTLLTSVCFIELRPLGGKIQTETFNGYLRFRQPPLYQNRLLINQRQQFFGLILKFVTYTLIIQCSIEFSLLHVRRAFLCNCRGARLLAVYERTAVRFQPPSYLITIRYLINYTTGNQLRCIGLEKASDRLCLGMYANE